MAGMGSVSPWYEPTPPDPTFPGSQVMPPCPRPSPHLEGLDQAQGLIHAAADRQVVHGLLAQGAVGGNDEQAAAVIRVEGGAGRSALCGFAARGGLGQPAKSETSQEKRPPHHATD